MAEQTGIIVNAVTGEEVIAPLSQEELDNIQSIKEQIESEVKSNSDARASALAKLAALGLTESEIAAL
jgi:DNA-binding NarL/FixJ family response regulator